MDKSKVVTVERERERKCSVKALYITRPDLRVVTDGSVTSS